MLTKIVESINYKMLWWDHCQQGNLPNCQQRGKVSCRKSVDGRLPVFRKQVADGFCKQGLALGIMLDGKAL